jgi:hypothetical protein
MLEGACSVGSVQDLNDTWEMEISGEVGQNDTPIKISYLERV